MATNTLLVNRLLGYTFTQCARHTSDFCPKRLFVLSRRSYRSSVIEEPRARQSALSSWLEALTGCPVSRIERHTSRREAWVATLDSSEAGRQLFVRVGLAESHSPSIRSVVQEMEIIRSLGGTPVPVPAVVGYDAELGAVAYELVAGSDDLADVADDLELQRISDMFMDELAQLHSMRPDDLDLVWPTLANSDHEVALGELEAALHGAAAPGATHPLDEPLVRFGLAWLRRNVPARPADLVLVQGDTGPGNFLFSPDGITAIIDWERAHLGDPLEDLGHLAVRSLYFRFGPLPAAIMRYAQARDVEVDLARVRYYAAASLVRGTIEKILMMAATDIHGSAELMLAYRAVGDRLCVAALADAMGIDLPAVASGPLDDSAADALDLHDVIVAVCADEAVPAVVDEHLRSRLASAARIAMYLKRAARLSGGREQVEVAELRSLLGQPVADERRGLAMLNGRIDLWQLDPEAVVRYLYGRAERQLTVAAPVLGRFGNLDYVRLR